MSLEAGTRLGPYEVLGLLGAGGMGEVYRALDTRLGREVAVKIPPPFLALDPHSYARFDREARAAAALAHPNILDVHDVGDAGGTPFVVTELLLGETLRERLARGRLPWQRAAEIGVAIAEGLGAAHAAGLVHRDIKPDNVFLTADGRVKILDFGLARDDPTSGAGRPASATLTEEGVVAGTAAYMAPERLRGIPADARSDLFSLGCVLYEMLSGGRAFEGESVAELWSAILRSEPRDLDEAAPDAPEDLRRVVRRCLEKSPAMRFQSAMDLTFALRMAGQGEATLPRRERSAPRAWPGLAAAAAAVVAALAVALVLRGRTPPPRGSVAVLPFAGSGRGADYLGEGLAENLINELARLPGVRVVARTTAFRFGAGSDARKAGRELGVDAVVTGRVAREGDRLVVHVDLVDVARGTQLWGERYGRPFADIAVVEDQIAKEIARALGTRLGGGEAAEPRRAETASAEAYDLTLRGRFHANRRDAEGIEEGLRLYGEALRKDPLYARAWCGIADGYNLVAFYGEAPPLTVVPKAREAALKALAIDERSPEAHVSLADILYQFDFDWAAAEREFKRAIELAPGSAAAHHWYSNFLSVSSRFEESMAEIEKARTLDPLNPLIGTDLALAYYWSGKLDEAGTRLSDVAGAEPGFPLVHLYLAVVRAHQRRFGEARDSLGKLESASGGPSPDSIALDGWIAARAGEPEKARRSLAALAALAEKRFVSAFPVAFVHVGLGENAAALTWLEKSLEENAGRLVYLNVERAFDPLRKEPRFREIVRRVRIPGAS